MLSSGFTNAPVAKSLVIYAVASSIGLAIFDIKHLAHLQVQPHLWQYGQFWRVLIWQVAGYANSTEALFAAILAYHLRVVERMWGSRKFATFIVTTLPYTTVLPPILLALIVRPLSLNNLNYLPSGPTAVVFALLAQYYATIPRTFKYRLSTSTSTGDGADPSPANTKPSLTILLSDKSTTYFIAAQLALSQFPATLLPSIVGWAVGLAWRADVIPVARQWRIPAWLVGEKEPARRRMVSSGSTGRDGNSGTREDGERYEDLRRRLDAAAAAATTTANSTAVEADSERRQRRPLLDRLRGVF